MRNARHGSVSRRMSSSDLVVALSNVRTENAFRDDVCTEKSVYDLASLDFRVHRLVRSGPSRPAPASEKFKKLKCV